jgi:leader peptidase (prepilin peptidase)/N-methyltransferase
MKFYHDKASREKVDVSRSWVTMRPFFEVDKNGGVSVEFVWVLLSGSLGACVGSFLNVVAWRTVHGRPWWGNERSRCDECGKPLSWPDLIPIVSFLVLRGRCRSCGKPFSSGYFLVEVAGAFIGVAVAWRWGFSWAALAGLVLGYGLLLNSLTDIYSGYVYDVFAWSPGVVVFLMRLAGGREALFDGLSGALLGFGVVAVIILASRGGMGWGDAGLAGGMGAALGWKLMAVGLYSGFMIGGVTALVLLLAKRVTRKQALPLVPFLALGGLVAILAGPMALEYFGLEAGWPWMEQGGQFFSHHFQRFQ